MRQNAVMIYIFYNYVSSNLLNVVEKENMLSSFNSKIEKFKAYISEKIKINAELYQNVLNTNLLCPPPIKLK
jgi:hypothetical protein